MFKHYCLWVLLLIVFKGNEGLAAEITPQTTSNTRSKPAEFTYTLPMKADSFHWVIDPLVPGNNLPPAGRSLFDFLITQKKGNVHTYDVPFPFEKLIQRIQGSKQQSGPNNASVKQVLIPMGRSLQRTAAAPEFFKYPRVVAAVDSESSNESNNQNFPMMFLKDRLYLGYQEKSNLIEVISYNEAAARFEFQIVKDYRAGGSPKVFYANRAICMSCHQNGAPIFSRQVWDETNANPKIATLLKNKKPQMYGVSIERGVDIPYAIDNAVDRANQFAALQLLWREGCGEQDRAAIRCRAGLFKALLQYKFSGDQQFDRSAQYQDVVIKQIAAIAEKKWPNGIGVGNPDIPNRDPLPGEAGMEIASDVLDATEKPGDLNALKKLANLSNIAVKFDPLNPRPPIEIWHLTQPKVIEQSVVGLSAFISDKDIAQLNHYLSSHSRSLPLRQHPFRCNTQQKNVSPIRQRIDFKCDALQNPALKEASINGYIEIEKMRVVEGAIERLQMDRWQLLQEMTLKAASIKPTPNNRSALLRFHGNGNVIRNSEGDAIEAIALDWSTGDVIKEMAVTLMVRQDFSLIKRAVDTLTADVETNVFGFKPFRRVDVISALFAQLGIKSPAWCCINAQHMPVAAMEDYPQTAAWPNDKNVVVKRDALRPFYRNCVTCHQTTEHFPPNFLAGSSERVNENLAHCAERLFVRLSMWQLPSESRAKSPMPPENAVHGNGYTTEKWRDDEDLAMLRTYTENVLKIQTGKTPQLDAFLQKGYENLRSCLPAS